MMHIYVAGIGGFGLGPIAEIALQMGWQVTGSDKLDSSRLDSLRRQGATINIGQTAQQLAACHADNPIDWYVYSSALIHTQVKNQELNYVLQAKIKHSKRDQFLNYILKVNNLKLLAVAGSHGKTTTTAMIIWLLEELGQPCSYLLGGKLPKLPAGRLIDESDWFVYEADEFDRNFLAFEPQLSLITGLDWDHFSIFKTRRDYHDAFRQFIVQSQQVMAYRRDLEHIYKLPPTNINWLTTSWESKIKLIGQVNRVDGSLACQAVQSILANLDQEQLLESINRFPGSSRRFEKIDTNLYSDYAHTIPKIKGCLQQARELNSSLVVIYEPHSLVRQHQIKEDYKHLFADCKSLYWLPIFDARPNLSLPPLTRETLVKDYVDSPQRRQSASLNNELLSSIKNHLKRGDLVVAISAGSGLESLDGWLRQNFKIES